ncbi:tyrosine-type recombinase/integrase [Levilactobacillus brevis]|uniref:tyrosine-type recombinase/integrase n=1 Tax=Levilactobacillus brevis TaxID=1580 RepID=UPI002011CF67|nr:tyrosine-type recombinase/integrase [Levilactobacillus brevis]
MSRVYANPMVGGRPYKAEFTIGSGKERRRKTKTFDDTKTAKKWLHQMQVDFDTGTTYEMSNWKFIDYYWHWVELYKVPVVSQNTLDTYRSSYTHFCKLLGTIKIGQLTRNNLQRYFNELGMSHESARKDLNHIRACLRDAVNDGVLARNPAAVRLNIIADPALTKSDDKKFMSVSAFKKIRNFLLEYDYQLYDVNRLALMIVSQTALRIGECLALKYDDIDLLHGTVRVDESWDSVHQYLKQPKTKHAKRTVPLPPKAVAILQRWIGYHRAMLFKLGIANPQHFLLLNRRGRLPVAKNVNTSYHQLQSRLGIPPKFSTHTLRHTLASLMIADKDISINYISRYLGHANTMITERYYIGLLPEQAEQTDATVLRVLSQ